MWHDPLFPISMLWMLFVVTFLKDWSICHGEYSILTVITFNLHGHTFPLLEIDIFFTHMKCVWNHPCSLKMSKLTCVALDHLNVLQLLWKAGGRFNCKWINMVWMLGSPADRLGLKTLWAVMLCGAKQKITTQGENPWHVLKSIFVESQTSG